MKLSLEYRIALIAAGATLAALGSMVACNSRSPHNPTYRYGLRLFCANLTPTEQNRQS